MPSPTLHPYDRWAPRYPPRPHNPLMEAEQSAMLRHLSRVRARRALDLGAGTGRYTRLMRSRGVAHVTALDRSGAMLSEMGPHRGVARVLADGRELPFEPEAFDLVVAGFVVGDFESLPALFAVVAAVLEDGGSFLYSDFHPEWETRGWRRTFVDVNGESVEVPFVPHSHEQHRHALASAGLRIVDMRDVSTTPTGGRWWSRASVPATPALIVVHATKSGSRA